MPDIILCRTDRFLPQSIKNKISLFSNVPPDAVVTAKDVETIYEVPLVFKQENLDRTILNLLRLPETEVHLEKLEKLVSANQESATPGDYRCDRQVRGA